MKRAHNNLVLMRKLDRQRRRTQHEEGCKFIPMSIVQVELLAMFREWEQVRHEILFNFGIPKNLVMPPEGRVSYPHPAGGK